MKVGRLCSKDCGEDKVVTRSGQGERIWLENGKATGLL